MLNNDNCNITDFKDFKNKKFADEPIDYEQIWEYPDSYEYRYIADYDQLFESTHMECVEIGGCFANLIEEGNKFYLISLSFDKEIGIPTLTDWLDFYKIELFEPSNSSIEIHNTDGVLEALKFKGHPIVLSMRGDGIATLEPTKLEEIVDSYEEYKGVTNTRVAEQVNIEDHTFDD